MRSRPLRTRGRSPIERRLLPLVLCTTLLACCSPQSQPAPGPTGSGKQTGATPGPGPGPKAPNPSASSAAGAGAVESPKGPPPVVRQSVRIVRTYPHDPKSFTQGLVFRDGVLFESSGQYGESQLRRVDLESGTVLELVDFQRGGIYARSGAPYFAEGLELVGDKLFQLTWKENDCLVWDRASLKLLQRLRYAGEGWGLCHDGQRLILSDGTPTLRFMDPTDLHELGRITVTLDGRPLQNLLQNLNELEWIDGQVWANVWQSSEILRIDPQSGRVVGRIDCQALVDAGAGSPEVPFPGYGPQNVLNGIAWDAVGRRLFLTGKHWPKLFEVELVGG